MHRSQDHGTPGFFSTYSQHDLSYKCTRDKTVAFQFLLCRKLKYQMFPKINSRNGRKEANTHICYFITNGSYMVVFLPGIWDSRAPLAIHKAAIFWILTPLILSISAPLSCRNVSAADTKWQKTQVECSCLSKLTTVNTLTNALLRWAGLHSHEIVTPLLVQLVV